MSEKDFFKIPTTGKTNRRLSLSTGFEISRLRKRPHMRDNEDCDSVSTHSLDVSTQSLDVSASSAKIKKCNRTLLRVSASLVNLLSSSSKQKNDNRTSKFRRLPLRENYSPYKPPTPSPARRSQQSWVDWVAGGKGHSSLPALSHLDIKRQEAIHELYQGEKDLVEDLINVTKLYRDSLLTLGLMSQGDVATLFGNIDMLIPVHQNLITRLQDQQNPDGTMHNVGKQIYDWARSLAVYVQYCSNQIQAKSIFDSKKNEPAIDDFFQRCIASPFSRKLDLWTLLDGARSRFLKYPLLIGSILKYTPRESGEAGYLETSIKRIEKIIRDTDEQAGFARCEHFKSSLAYLFDDQKIPEIEESKTLLCSGFMKNTKGSKLYVLLFDKVAVISRPTNQGCKQMYQIYRQPIPATELVVEDLPDGEVKLGSFRSAFGQGGQLAKNLLRLSFQTADRGQSHTLIVSDEHDKRQWMQSLNQVAAKTVMVRGDSRARDRQSIS